MQAPNNLATRATRRKAAKAEVLAAYYTSAPRGQIVERLRQIPEDVVAEVIDEMVNEEEYDDADELRSMAFQAGYNPPGDRPDRGSFRSTETIPRDSGINPATRKTGSEMQPRSSGDRPNRDQRSTQRPRARGD